MTTLGVGTWLSLGWEFPQHPSLPELPWNLHLPCALWPEVPVPVPWLTGPAGATLIHSLFHKKDSGAGKGLGLNL